MFIEQDYDKYADEQHLVWNKLFERRIPSLRETASASFLEGIEAIGLDPNRIPNLDEVNERLTPKTGWRSVGVDGYLPAREFFSCLAARKFPTTIDIRPMSQLDYLPEPDIFHDIFGHVPMHANPVFADFLQYYGKIAFRERDKQRLEELSRLFWFTVEFGLIREAGRVKLFGSGLMSSIGEGAHCLTAAVEKRPFELWDVVSTSFEIDHYQPVLFVIDSFEQLVDAMTEWEDS